MASPSSTIRVVIADDCSIFRDGFQLMFSKEQEIKIVGQARNGSELIQVVINQKPDVVVTDVSIPEIDGVEATRILTKQFPCLGIIALSNTANEEFFVQMLGAGARGYLLKNTTTTEMIMAVKTVSKFGTYYCSSTTRKILKILTESNDSFDLRNRPKFSEKELVIIKLICEQYSNKQIASNLNLSCRSVESTRERIQEKIGAKNMVGIAIYAIKIGLFKAS